MVFQCVKPSSHRYYLVLFVEFKTQLAIDIASYIKPIVRRLMNQLNDPNFRTAFKKRGEHKGEIVVCLKEGHTVYTPKAWKNA